MTQRLDNTSVQGSLSPKPEHQERGSTSNISTLGHLLVVTSSGFSEFVLWTPLSDHVPFRYWGSQLEPHMPDRYSSKVMSKLDADTALGKWLENFSNLNGFRVPWDDVQALHHLKKASSALSVDFLYLFLRSFTHFRWVSPNHHTSAFSNSTILPRDVPKIRWGLFGPTSSRSFFKPKFWVVTHWFLGST